MAIQAQFPNGSEEQTAFCDTHTHTHTHTQGVANAVGAALGTVGGSCDYIEDLGIIKKELQKEDEGVEEGDQLDKMAREVAEQRGIEHATREAIRKGEQCNSAFCFLI